MKLLAEAFTGDQGSSEDMKEIVKLRTWSDLPADLFVSILSWLTLKENIRISSVCKEWLSVAISVWVVNRPQWIMLFQTNGDIFEFYDPSQGQPYSIELPELRGCKICTVCCSKDNWLLLTKAEHNTCYF